MEADADALNDLKSALAGLSSDVTLPEGDMRSNPQASALFDAIDALMEKRQFESYPDKSEAFTLVEDRFSSATGDEHSILLAAVLRRNDQGFIDQKAKGLSVFRVDFSGRGCSIPERDFDLVLVGDGLIPRSTRADEGPVIALYVELQVFVSNEDGSPAVAEAKERSLDDFELAGSIAELYRARHVRRVAWGSGSCLLTDQRLIGLLFDDEIHNRPDTKEAVNMPLSAVTGEVSSAVVFEADRGQFKKREITAGSGAVSKFVLNRLPIVNLYGADCHIVLNVIRAVRPDGKIERPKKGEVDQAVLTFCGG